ncbi:MAG: hypothetical protein H7246_13520 [Phycisphaerae bacterium]|nr:hypothetical protein [Saprospiraceae bacterium]
MKKGNAIANSWNSPTNFDMNNNSVFDKIEAWLSGELPEAEARTFEAEMAADTAFAAEVERHRRGREALDRLAEQALQTDMARWRTSLDELPEPPTDVLPTKGTNWLRWILGGLLGFLLVGAAYWFWPSEKAQSDNTPVQEIVPPQTKSHTPIADTPPNEPVNENKDPKEKEENNSPRLIAMAETNLSDLQGAILQQYGQTMGDDDEENPFFTTGLKAFKGTDLKTAKRDLLQVTKTDPFFPSAQEILAYIYFREKNYPKAVQCYESFASQSADPAADWRLLQFYLMDYQHRKADFSKKLGEISDPEKQHRYQKEAVKLKRELGKIGIK